MSILSVFRFTNKKWFQSVLIYFMLVLLDKTSSSSNDANNNNIKIEELPFCGDNTEQQFTSNRLIFVSTLDGKLSAIDRLDGSLKWSVQTGSQLLSSSIHRLELTNNGQWVRMIPSLSGGLYQFDGDSIEAIPITADNLLSSSFKFSDDLVISGGKETSTYGISSRTGEMLYACTMSGCKNHTNLSSGDGQTQEVDDNDIQSAHNPAVDDVIVIRRLTQTVRAIEPRTGSERWNFSVGHHDLEILQSENCHNVPISETDKSLLDLDLRVVVPEGVICGLDASNPTQIMWKHKFDFPIVSAWKVLNENSLQNIDLFTSSTSEWLTNPEHISPKDVQISPSVYVGMFQKQLYIQENDVLKNFIHKDKTQLTDNIKYPRIPWKPYPATSSSLVLIENDITEDDNKNAVISIQDTEPVPAVTALSILYASEYVNGNGFFLFSSEDLNKTQTSLCNSEKEEEIKETNDNETDDFAFPFDSDIPAKIVIVSLWFWWKEICVIAISSAIILNLFITRKVKKEREVVVVERHVEVPIIIEKESALVEHKSRSSLRSTSESNQHENFTSRFLTDFDLVRCLGKGGFGVVFEVKNKLDDCNYAIKRIVLPNKQESRDRVMREVKTLANCEHQHIVRYFQAWVETPPNGWQEKQDVILFEKANLCTSIDIETPTDSVPPKYIVSNEVITNPKHINSWISNLKTNECLNFDDEKRKTRITNNKNDGSYSLIQFPINDDLSSSVFSNSNRLHNRHTNTDDDSFQIEFKNSTNGKNDDEQNEIISIPHSTCSHISNDSKSFKKHRRPLSLDLSSNGKLIPPAHQSTKMYLYIQMQLCRKQSLRDWLRENDRSARQEQVLQIFQQIVEAVEYVHMKGLIHRDLKPSNIFFSLDGQIRIGDFGLVTDMSEIPNMITSCGDESGLPSCAKHTEQVGTHLYMSPEQLQGKPYNYKVDIYSLGLILFELLVVFTTEMERIETIKKLRISHFPSDFQITFAKEFELLKLMLSQSPNERPTTFGIRARPPLEHLTNDEWHFELPPRRHNSRTSSISISNFSSSSGS